MDRCVSQGGPDAIEIWLTYHNSHGLDEMTFWIPFLLLARLLLGKRGLLVYLPRLQRSRREELILPDGTAIKSTFANRDNILYRTHAAGLLKALLDFCAILTPRPMKSHRFRVLLLL